MWVIFQQEDDLDALAEDPLSLLESEADADADGGADDEEYDSPEGAMRAEYAALSGYGRPLLNNDMNVTFPSRPLVSGLRTPNTCACTAHGTLCYRHNIEFFSCGSDCGGGGGPKVSVAVCD